MPVPQPFKQLCFKLFVDARCYYVVGINPSGWLPSMRPPILLNVVLLTGLCVLEQAAPPKFILTPEVQADLDRIRAASLRGDLSFIASDALDGRDTPSPGLDIAAEYIAAQFRRAGLEPAGDDGYFQTARMEVLGPNFEGFEITLGEGERSYAAAPDGRRAEPVRGAGFEGHAHLQTGSRR